MTRLLLLIMAYALFFPAAAFSLDEVQSRLLGGFGLPLRWYNVEGPPQLIAGHDPVPDPGSPRRLLKLAPGESATIWLPAWETLRLDAAVGTLAADDLQVAFSSGGGLFRHQPGIPATNGRSLLFSPSSPSPLFARLSRLPRHTSPLAVAAYLSHREPLDEIAPYRRLLALPLEEVLLSRPGRPGKESCWSLPAGERVSVTVKGPVRVALENRLVYPEKESGRSFTYRLEADIDGGSGQLLEFETAPDPEPARQEGGERRLLGRRQTGYLEVPAGEHQLNLKSAVPLYLRLLARERPDYLFPALNASAPSAAGANEDASPQLPGSFALLGDRELAGAVAGPDTSPLFSERAALSSARDNRRRDGGTVGAALLREAGERRPDYPEVRERAEQFAGAHTFYRDLLPEVTGPSAAAAFRWFLPLALAEPDAHPFGRVVGEQQTGELVRMLPGGTFFTIPAGRATVLRYQLPARFAPSLLRVALPADALQGGGELVLQYDDLAPERLLIDEAPLVARDRVPVLPAEAGLLLLADSHRSPWPVTLGGAFAGISAPAPLIRGADLELPLPRQVTTIRVWREGGSQQPLPVALQYRTSAPYRMAETEFLATRAALGPGKSAFSAFSHLAARDPETARPTAPFAPLEELYAVADRELESEQLPLARLIRLLQRSYTSTLAAPPAAGTQPPPTAAAILERAAAAARQAQRRGDWLSAVEAWGIPAQSGTGTMRREALFGQITALIRLNEENLAEHRLKGLFVYGEDAQTSSLAQTALERLYAEAGDADSLLSLRATAFLRNPAPELLSALGHSLLEAGEPELALQAFLVLAPADRPRAATLQASWLLGWWQSFENTLAEGANPQETSLWQGLRAMSEGRYAAAAAGMREGGSEGSAWERHLEEGLRIRSSLTDRDRERRLAAVADWERWQSAHPGPRAWQPEKGAITGGAGTATLTNVARDTSFSAFRATQAQPVSLRLAGPVKIRIEARPVHPAGSRLPLDGWLQVAGGESLHVQPITGNLPARGLSMWGDKAESAGLKVELDIELGPGLHELQVSGGSLDLLVRVSAWRPALPAAPLPPLTPETLLAAVDGLYVPAPPAEDPALVPESARIFSVSRDGREQTRQLPFTRGGLLGPAGRADAIQSVSGTPAGARLSSLRAEEAPGPEQQSALLLGRGDCDGLLRMASEPSGLDIVQRASLLLWVAEQKEEHYLTALSYVRALSASNGGTPGLSRIVERLSRRGSWVPVTAVASSAGLRTVEMAGWRPETPALRIRRALLPLTADHEQILSDAGRLVLTMVNRTPRILEMTLAAEEPAYLTPQPLQVSYQLDGIRPKRLTLKPGQTPQTVHLTVPPGRHVVRIGIDERFADQFLRVGLRERQAGPGRNKAVSSPVVNSIERPYQVATLREPIRLRMEGPVILRIDQLRDGTSVTGYRMIAAGPQQVEIAPEKGRREGLYRFFTQVVVAEKPLVPVRHQEVLPRPVPPPAVTITSAPSPGRVRLSDAFTLGRQEDGSWSVEGELVRRKPVQEGADEDLIPEQFLESSLTHRYFDGKRRYHQWGALARLREYGSPTLGVHAMVRQRPLYLPFIWSIAGTLHLQSPAGNPVLPQEHAQWATSLQGSIYQVRVLTPKTWHRPALSLFGRVLSRSDIDSDDRREYDQDIFTRYKSEHRYGARLSESLTHRPWLDTLWNGTLSLASNELDDHLVPDHLSLALGWKQLLGAFQGSVLYRSTLYMPDRDRPDTLLRNDLRAELTYNRWLKNRDRLELAARFGWHFESEDLTSMLSLTWHFENGGNLRDFEELDFRDLRQRSTPDSANNGMIYEPS